MTSRIDSHYLDPVIMRMCEANVRPERLDDFLVLLRDLVAGFPAAHDGMVSHDVLVDLGQPNRVQYVSRWRDESAITEFAGADWATSVVTFPDEESYLLEPLRLRHYTVDEG